MWTWMGGNGWRRTRLGRWAAVLALVPLVTLLTGCPLPEEQCDYEETGCHPPEIAVGRPPNCDCRWPGQEEQPPIIQSPDGQRLTGNVRVFGVDGWSVEEVAAAPASVSAKGSHAQLGPVASAPYAAQVLGTDLRDASFRVSDLHGEFGGVLGTQAPALRVRWAGPLRIKLRSPGGVVSQYQFGLPYSDLAVKPTRINASVTRLDGELALGSVRVTVVAFLAPGTN